MGEQGRHHWLRPARSGVWASASVTLEPKSPRRCHPGAAVPPLPQPCVQTSRTHVATSEPALLPAQLLQGPGAHSREARRRGPGGEFGPQREGTEVGGCVGSEEGPGRGASESCRYQVRLERVELAMRRSEWERASGVAKAGRTGGLGMREDLRTGRRNSWENKRKACSWESAERSGG